MNRQKNANSPNTMKIESWVPQSKDNPIPHFFGRIDASRGSSGDMTPDNGSTKRCENRCVGASGDGRIEYDHVWSRGRTDIRFDSRYDVSDGAILKT